jgi:hypothetical protein
MQTTLPAKPAKTPKPYIKTPANTPFYETAEALQAQVDDYREWCAEHDQRPTIAGLAYHLGYSDRNSIYDLEAHPRYSSTIKRARLAIESGIAADLCKWGPGAIFILKNHHGYRDEKHIQQTTTQVSDGPEMVKAITRLLQETGITPQHVVVEHDDNQPDTVINNDNAMKSIGYENE